MRRRPLILVSLLLAAFVINLDITIVNVALPTLVRELHATNSQLQWVVDAYNLVFAALAAGLRQPQRPPRPQRLSAGRPGRLGSRQHRRRSDLYRRRADRRPLLHGSRRRDDLPLHPLADLERVHRADRARPRDRPLGATAGIAIALGPIVGGWLLEQFSWTSIFFAMAPVAFVGAVLVAWSVPTSRDPDATKTDGPGLVLSSAAMALLTYTIIEAPNPAGAAAAASRASHSQRGCSRPSSSASAPPQSRCSTSASSATLASPPPAAPSPSSSSHCPASAS